MNKVSNFLTYCCLQCSPTLLTSVGTAAMSFVLMSVVKLTGVCFEICHRVWLGECFLCPCKERTFCVVGGSVCQRHVVVDDVVVPFLSALTDFGQRLSEEGCGSPAGNGSSAARLRPVRCRVTWFESAYQLHPHGGSWRVVMFPWWIWVYYSCLSFTLTKPPSFLLAVLLPWGTVIRC